MAIKNTNNKIMAAAVFSTKARSGLAAHKKTCTGRAVAGDVTLEGISATKATMPIISRGALSPKARDMPMIVPVKIPGMASGRTW